MTTLRLSILSVVTALSIVALLGLSHSEASQQTFITREVIAFASTREGNLDIYLMNPDGTDQRRLTANTGGANGIPSLSPDGKKAVFDSNRIGITEPPPTPRCAQCSNTNVSDLFVMNMDDYDPVLQQIPVDKQLHLTRGSSATWSPDARYIAFHASASGTMGPIKPDPGAATYDSDIFVMSVDDCLKLIQLTNQDPTKGDCRKTTAADCNMIADSVKRAQCTKILPEFLKNITNNPSAVDDDPDWSPDGTKTAFTSHSVNDNHNNSVTAEIYLINADGTGQAARLTNNMQEERAPDWSKKDGSRIVFACRQGSNATFEICVMNADGTGQVRLTFNTVPDLTSSWSLDDQKIAFGRQVAAGQQQIFVMNADSTGLTQLTTSAGTNLFPNWGVVRVPAP